MKKFTVLILFLGMFFAISADQNKGSMKEYLGLSAEQEQKMKTLKEMCRNEDSASFAKLGELRKNLFAEAGKDNPDMEKINKISNEIGKQHSMLALCLANQIKEVKKILTKEQFAKFIDLRQNKSKNFNQNKKK